MNVLIRRTSYEECYKVLHALGTPIEKSIAHPQDQTQTIQIMHLPNGKTVQGFLGGLDENISGCTPGLYVGIHDLHLVVD